MAVGSAKCSGVSDFHFACVVSTCERLTLRLPSAGYHWLLRSFRDVHVRAGSSLQDASSPLRLSAWLDAPVVSEFMLVW